MAPGLDSHVIRASSPAEVAQFFRETLATSSVELVTEQLLQAIESGSVVPATFAIWLGVSGSPIPIQQALKQNVSVELRKFAIKRLRKELKSARWKETWTSLGGTSGLLQTLSDLSVLQIREICTAIGSAAHEDITEKREEFTKLFEALFPPEFPNSPFRTKDARPLKKQYQRLVSACTPNTVRNILDHNVEGEWNDLPQKFLLRYQSDVLRDFSLQKMLHGRNAPNWLSSLFTRYPQGAGTYPGFSASMQFSFHVLKTLVEDTRYTISDSEFLLILVEPLMRRAVKKKVARSTQCEILDLTVRYLDRNPNANATLRLDRGRLLHITAQCWSHKPDVFRKPFNSLLLHYRKNVKAVGIEHFEPLLYGITRPRRFSLLQFCYKVAEGRDIESEGDLKTAKGTLSYSLLSQLESGDALSLYTHLRKARGDLKLVGNGPSSSVASINATIDGSGGDPNLIEILLRHRHGEEKEAAVLAETFMQDRMKKSMSSSDQNQRGWYAQSAKYYAIASGSSKLFKDFIMWARRFVRDPHTIPRLYGDFNEEAAAIACGIPRKVTSGLNHSNLRAHIEEGNSILRLLLDTVCSTLREPSFNLTYWKGALMLFSSVVQLRIKRVRELSRLNEFTDDELYRMVWEDTINLVVYADEQGLKTGHERMRMNTLGGILVFSGVMNIWSHEKTFEVKDEPPSTYRFLDDLAKIRNQLWQTHRVSIHPEVTTLREPWPRGLPVQYLAGPFKIRTPDLEIYAPYLTARMKAVVFFDPATAFEPFPEDEDEDAKAAIGVFVDDYSFALKMFIPEDLGKEEKKDRVDRAWSHAITSLTKHRMNQGEAIRFWRHHTGNTDIEFWPPPNKKEPAIWPIVLIVDDPLNVEEWNPAPMHKKEIKGRTLDQVTYLDLTTRVRFHRSNPDIGDGMKCPKLAIPGESFKEDPIWSGIRISRSKFVPEMREGQILSAMLFLDTKNAVKDRILASPFPSQDDVRYPAIYLDDHFLTKSNESSYSALAALEAHVKSVPPSLLYSLTKNTLAAMELADPSKSEFIDLESRAFELVKLLGQCDRPGLACQLSVQTIMQRPKASSWHRQLLSPGLFRRLSVSDARACFTDFANSIIEALKTPAQAKEADQENKGEAEAHLDSANSNKKTQKQPMVKITTVKFLAQLLRNSEFVLEDFAFEILSRLSKKASHIDIRRAVVDSLLTMFRTSTRELSEKILLNLEEILPMVGNLDERRPMSQEDWNAASKASTVPSPPDLDIYTDTTETTAPILHTLRDFLGTVPINFPYRMAYTDRIILPITEISKQEMRKWLKIFLASIQAPSTLIEVLPLVPRNIDGWRKQLLRNSQYLPLSFLEEYINYVLFCMKPPTAIIDINRALEADPIVRSKPETQAWLSLYGFGRKVLNYYTPVNHALLQAKDSFRAENGITTKTVQARYLTVFTAALWSDGPHYVYVKSMIHQLQPTKFNEEWQKRKQPIVEAIILYIDSIRTRDWERDANRQPQVLPDTYGLRLWLLKYPSSTGLQGDQEERCKAYAYQLYKHGDNITGSLYHKKLAQIKESFKFVEGADRMFVALELGNIKNTRLSWLSMQDVLRVELAAELLKKEHHKDLRVKEMLKSWVECDNEEVRRMGFEIGGTSV